MATNWQELASKSQYQTAIAVREKLVEKETDEAATGLEELIDALSRSDQRALRSHLLRLMSHIIKWKTQAERRSRSWAASIESARIEIEDLLELEPSLRPKVPALLTDLFEKSKRLAEKEMGRAAGIASLSEQEIFEEEYDSQLISDE